MNSQHALIAPDVGEETFVSPYDGTEQTFLLKDFRASATAACPLLVVYLHGSHSHQEQGMTSGIYGNFFGRLGQFLNDRGAVYACPEYRGNSWMGPAAEADVAEILRLLKLRFLPSRTLLIGGSMGGTSALIYAMRHRQEVDGILAFCPATDPAEVFERDDRFRADLQASYGGTPSQVPDVYLQRTSRVAASQFVGLPLVIVHGTDDRSIPIRHSELLVAALERCGAHFLYERVEGGGHDSPLDPPFERFFSFLGV